MTVRIIHTDPCECVWTMQDGLVKPCRDHADWLRKSVEAEREECATVADWIFERTSRFPDTEGDARAATEIAAKIRASRLAVLRSASAW